MPFTVEDAIAIATRAHQGQRDKSGHPYVGHPLANPLALAVKRADIADNVAPDRMAELDGPTRARLQAKYAKATRLLDEYTQASSQS